ncbi:CWF19-like protein 1 -like protein [Trichinella nativa]|uniref:CWF19-like protein 1-like protein n=1 Tax=Trichinella nativa TaxID=6335 RepID=A0A0V1KSX5_9BILA|nr:CWF19-like protein 1 -like protein [Trichinella nativa]
MIIIPSTFVISNVYKENNSNKAVKIDLYYNLPNNCNVDADVRPGIVAASVAKRYKVENAKVAADLQNRQLKSGERERVLRETALETAIDERNKGFLMLKKMGFTPGSALGKRPSNSELHKANEHLKEPLKLVLKTDRMGLGHEDEEAKRAKEMAEVMRREKERLNKEYKERNRKRSNYQSLVKAFSAAQKTCYNLDISIDSDTTPLENWYWPWFAVKKKDGLEDEDDAVKEKAHVELPESVLCRRLDELKMYLRTKYNYCIWCCVHYQTCEFKAKMICLKAVLVKMKMNTINLVNPYQQRILVCGDVDGNFVNLWVRMEQVLRKVGTFEMMLVCGEFFGADLQENRRVLNGELRCTIPTYILGPLKVDSVRNYRTEAGAELGHNLIYLGKKGIFTSASGLTIAYLSGTEAEYEDETHFSAETVDSLIGQATARANFIGVDILLTSQWPLGVEKNSSYIPDLFEDEELNCSALVSKLAAALKPRYHFSANTGCHYERPPYRNHKMLQEQTCHPTRFIGLARNGNPQKLKYLFAFNIVPMKHMVRSQLIDLPDNTTEFPYAEVLEELENKINIRKRKAHHSIPTTKQFFFDMAQAEASAVDNRNSNSKKRFRTAVPQKKVNIGPCWFCLSSEEVQKHLIISIGDSAYLSLTKGGLCDDHFLITPIGHIQSMVEADDDVLEDIEKYKESLRKFFAAQDRTVIFFERNYRTQHLQVHAVPIANSKSMLVRQCFIQAAANHGVDMAELSEDVSLGDIASPGCPYFYAELPYGQRLFVRRMKQFPVQFAREALTNKDLLNCPERIDWRQCALSVEEETALALKFRSLFSPYDFNQNLLS